MSFIGSECYSIHISLIDSASLRLEDMLSYRCRFLAIGSRKLNRTWKLSYADFLAFSLSLPLWLIYIYIFHIWLVSNKVEKVTIFEAHDCQGYYESTEWHEEMTTKAVGVLGDMKKWLLRLWEYWVTWRNDVQGAVLAMYWVKRRNDLICFVKEHMPRFAFCAIRYSLTTHLKNIITKNKKKKKKKKKHDQYTFFTTDANNRRHLDIHYRTDS
jgi:hypothetical protein